MAKRAAEIHHQCFVRAGHKYPILARTYVEEHTSQQLSFIAENQHQMIDDPNGSFSVAMSTKCVSGRTCSWGNVRGRERRWGLRHNVTATTEKKQSGWEPSYHTHARTRSTHALRPASDALHRRCRHGSDEHDRTASMLSGPLSHALDQAGQSPLRRSLVVDSFPRACA